MAQVRVCPTCGTPNTVFEAYCTACSTDLMDVIPIDESLMNPFSSNVAPVAPTTITLVNLDLVNRQPDGQTYNLTGRQGELVIGRSSGTDVPDVDLKDWTVPYVSNAANDPNRGMSQRGISRRHAVLVVDGDQVSIYRHPDCHNSISLQVNDLEVNGGTLDSSQPLAHGDVIAMGDIFTPGTKAKAPGLLFMVQIG